MISGAYTTFLKHMPLNNIKTRETIGLGFPGSFVINQPHNHHFNRFQPPPNENVFQSFNSPSLGAFSIFKHPQANDVNYQFDDYTRNLVPPPPVYKNREQNKMKERPIKEMPKIKETPVQVQVTKEKLNVFHNKIPATYSGDYVDYDFHSVRRPTNQPKVQTYEVTENKIVETPQYIPQIRKPTVPQKTRKQPEVELNFPPFLPTPYRPEGQGIVPTSPTQDEVSTIFTKLSKIQKEKEYSSRDPYVPYDVKEVSTHYPILGNPSFEYPSTDVMNEIRTKEETTTTPEPPKRRPTRKRRPGLRYRPSTTEETRTNEEFDSHKEENGDATESVETEKPRVRRPTR